MACLDPQFFLDWFQDMDMYFTGYPLSESRKVKFATMKHTGQASQYWTNVETLRASRAQRPIKTGAAMKDELKGKYVPPFYYACLLNKRHQFSHDNKSTKEYVAKFDEFLIRCSVIGTESEAPF